MFASAALNRRAASFEQMERLIDYIETRIRYLALPVGELLAGAAESGDFEALTFLNAVRSALSRGGTPAEAWSAGLRQRGGEDGFTPADRALLMEFGRGLGLSDTEGQRLHCETYRRFMGERREAARREAGIKGRLYRTLGLAGGACAALLLW